MGERIALCVEVRVVTCEGGRMAMCVGIVTALDFEAQRKKKISIIR